jgi:hypothetical protein
MAVKAFAASASPMSFISNKFLRIKTDERLLQGTVRATVAMYLHQVLGSTVKSKNQRLSKSYPQAVS